MYLKLSFGCLLIGLISQTFAALNSSTKPIDSDEYLAANYVVNDEETINIQSDSEDIINTFETTETTFSETSKNSDMIRYMRIFAYIEKCLNRENTTVFDIEAIHDHIVQAMHPEESLSLDEITIQVNAIFDYIVDNRNETDEFQDAMRQATETFVSIILAAKKSELGEIVEIIAEASKKLMAVITDDSEGRNTLLIQSMKAKILTATLLKDDLSMATYYLDFLLNITQKLDIYEGNISFYEIFGDLKSLFEQTERHITNAQTPIKDQLVEVSTVILKTISDDMSFMAHTDMLEDYKFGGARCMVEDAVMEIFRRTFEMNFLSAIDSKNDTAL